MNSLWTRLFAAFVLVILLVSLLIGLGLFVLLRNSPLVDRQPLAELTGAVRTALREGSRPPAGGDPAALQRYVGDIAAAYEVRVLMLTAAGQVLADSSAGDPLPDFNLRTLPRDAADGVRTGLARDGQGGVWLFVARGVPPDRLIVFAQPRARLSALTLFLEDILWPLMQAGLIAALAALGLALLISRSIARPLQQMAGVAQGIAQGDYTRHAPTGGPAEVRALGQALNAMSAQVQASQQTQRDFLANVSHELKTPLTSIQGFAQAIADGTADSPQALQRSGAIIHQEAERMRHMVADLLDLARLDAGLRALDRSPLDLRLILSAAVERFRPRAGEKAIHLQADLAEHLPPMIGDGERLSQVVANLLDNALKHTPSGGRVVLAAAGAEGGVEVAVKDSGAGIPPDDLGRIFERFYQVDKSRARSGGMGLGLAIAKEIVEAHGGRLRAESVVGLGSKFTVWLPLARPDDSTLVRRKDRR